MLAASREPLCHGCRPASYESLILMSIVPSYYRLVLSPNESAVGSYNWMGTRPNGRETRSVAANQHAFIFSFMGGV